MNEEQSTTSELCFVFETCEAEICKVERDSDTEIKNQVCGKCQKSFSDETELNEHSCSNVTKKNHVCGKCQKSFTVRSNLNRHIYNIHGERKVKICDICHKKVSDKIGAKKHNCCQDIAPKKSIKNKRLNCNECQNSFSTRSNLRRHIYNVHDSRNVTHSDNDIKRFGCDMCSLRFTESSRLKRHLLSHTGEKPHFCDICKKSFYVRMDLKRHLMIHTGEKSYACEICNKKFRASGTLNKHILVHTGEKSFTCAICDKKFSTKGNLNSHLRSHTGEKPYECEICFRRFSHKFHVNNHMLIHTGERPFVCEICQKTFPWKKSLKRHYQKHAKIIPVDSTDSDLQINAKSVVGTLSVSKDIKKDCSWYKHKFLICMD